MSYWNMVVHEVVNRHASTASFCFTHRLPESGGGGSSSSAKKKKRPSTKKSYSLGPKFPGISFTEQEAACMKLALKGKTIAGIGAALDLSARTVEFYLLKMRRKLNCATKSELVEKVTSSDFLKNSGE